MEFRSRYGSSHPLWNSIAGVGASARLRLVALPNTHSCGTKQGFLVAMQQRAIDDAASRSLGGARGIGKLSRWQRLRRSSHSVGAVRGVGHGSFGQGATRRATRPNRHRSCGFPYLAVYTEELAKAVEFHSRRANRGLAARRRGHFSLWTSIANKKPSFMSHCTALRSALGASSRQSHSK
jgi:hypothetical protein